MKPLRIITLFSGYDSQCLALNRLGIPYELVRWCEIDKYAIKAHDALFPQYADCNLGDVSAVDWSVVPGDIDLLTYSFPCTDISMAGRQEGLKEGSGTASSLLWECRRAISALRPRFAVMENVANLLSKHHKPEFDRWCREMEDMGYVNYCRILNAKDYNVPQNRRRVFMVSILGGERNYQFPAPTPLKRPLKSLLERGVDEKYYIPDERVAILLSSAKMEKVTGGDPAVLGWTRDKKGEIVDRHPVDIANCVTACPMDNTSNYVLEQVFLNGDKDGCASTVTTTHDFAGNIVSPSGGHKQMGVLEYRAPEPVIIDDFYLERPPRLYDEYSLTLRSERIGLKTIDGVRVRRLTERELFRLMDVEDKDIDTLLGSGVSKTQLAKMAGNSIVVNVLYHIFRTMFIDTEKTEGSQTSLF